MERLNKINLTKGLKDGTYNAYIVMFINYNILAEMFNKAIDFDKTKVLPFYYPSIFDLFTHMVLQDKYEDNGENPYFDDELLTYHDEFFKEYEETFHRPLESTITEILDAKVNEFTNEFPKWCSKWLVRNADKWYDDYTFAQFCGKGDCSILFEKNINNGEASFYLDKYNDDYATPIFIGEDDFEGRTFLSLTKADEVGVTKDDIKYEITYMLESELDDSVEDNPKYDNFIEHTLEGVLECVTWENPLTIVDRMDMLDEWECFQ